MLVSEAFFVMSSQSPALVSIVIPMYNNVEHVAECLESVRAQTYEHWDCVIVNNCSNDGSAEIARQFAELDSRIRVLENETFLPALANHNCALRQISPTSKYCKVVFSDDWLFPRCLEEMVALAEAHPSVSIVGAYGLQGVETMVKWAGLPYPSTRVDGRAVCRRFFLDDVYVFGTAQSLLFRSDLVRSRDPFFNEDNLHADMEVCSDLLRSSDFGFVHQVLTFTREREGSLTEMSRWLNTFVGGRLYQLVKYGPEFLSPHEYRSCRAKVLNEYYNFLAVSLLKGRLDTEFWDYHKQRLAKAEVEFSYSRLTVAVLVRILQAVTHLPETLKKLKLTPARRVANGSASGSRRPPAARANRVQGASVANRNFQAPPSPQEKTGLSST
jgi:glycosyltransferase involved in cell wall biosynthesis